MSPGALCILRAMDGGLGTTGWGRRLVVMAHVGVGDTVAKGCPEGSQHRGRLCAWAVLWEPSRNYGIHC